jgi:hypothetical protein
MSLLSERKSASGIQLSPTTHSAILIDESTSTLDLHNELTMKLSQARGMVALIACIDPEELGNVPEGALGQTAWAIDEQLDAVETLVDMIYSRQATKPKSKSIKEAV